MKLSRLLYLKKSMNILKLFSKEMKNALLSEYNL